jgi:thiol-disulfide isomerase/thioredoxin
MRRRIVTLAAAAAFVVLVGALWTYARFVARPRVETAAQVETAGQGAFGVVRTDIAAPPIELPQLDGGRFSLASARGEVVFVNFWATWCPPCRDEMPSMARLGRELAERYPGKFRMVAVSVDEDWNAVREYLGAPPFSGDLGIKVVLDAEHAATKAYYCASRGGVCPALKFPETYIVDKAGRLVAYIVGPRDWSDPAARAFLESLIRS